MSTDYLGNYLFGYYGQGVLLLNGEALKVGAGGAQILSDAKNGDPSKLIGYGLGLRINPALDVLCWVLNDYGDNPGDGEMIQVRRRIHKVLLIYRAIFVRL